MAEGDLTTVELVRAQIGDYTLGEDIDTDSKIATFITAASDLIRTDTLRSWGLEEPDTTKSFFLGSQFGVTRGLATGSTWQSFGAQDLQADGATPVVTLNGDTLTVGVDYAFRGSNAGHGLYYHAIEFASPQNGIVAITGDWGIPLAKCPAGLTVLAAIAAGTWSKQDIMAFGSTITVAGSTELFTRPEVLPSAVAQGIKKYARISGVV